MKFDSAETLAVHTTSQVFPTELERLHSMVAIHTKKVMSDIRPIRVYSRCLPIVDLEAELLMQPTIYAFVASNPVRTIIYLGHSGGTKKRLGLTTLKNKLGHELFWEAGLLDPEFKVYIFPVSEGINEHALIPYFNPPFNIQYNSLKALYKRQKKRKKFLDYVRENPRCDLSSLTSAVRCSRAEAKEYGEELKRMGLIDFEEEKSIMNGLKWAYWAL